MICENPENPFQSKLVFILQRRKKMSYGRSGRRDNTFHARGCSGIPGQWDSPTGKVLYKTSSGLNVTSADCSEAQRGATLHGDVAQCL